MKRYVTAGIQNHVDPLTQLALWRLYDEMSCTEKDYLQIFKLSTLPYNGSLIHTVIHMQEEPAYHKQHYLPAYSILSGRVYIIDDTHQTMLWACEY